MGTEKNRNERDLLNFLAGHPEEGRPAGSEPAPETNASPAVEQSLDASPSPSAERASAESRASASAPEPARAPSKFAPLLAQLKNGLLTENPTFVQLLGMCPTLAVTTSVSNGIGMGLAATAVLIMSNFVISLLRKVIPSKVRIASYVTIIAGFVTMIDLLLQAFVPALSKSLGLFIPLIVVNCIILARAEAFASKNGPGRSALDGLSMGLGFTVALTLISAVRELLGAGTLLGFPVLGDRFEPATMMILPPGGFLVLGCLIALVQFIMQRKGADK